MKKNFWRGYTASQVIDFLDNYDSGSTSEVPDEILEMTDGARKELRRDAEGVLGQELFESKQRHG